MKEKFKIIPTVYLILDRKDEILLSRRYNTGFKDGDYSFPAGHLDGNETLMQAMIRETKEEIGVNIKAKDISLVHIMHRKEPLEERINFFFNVKKWTGEPRIMEADKCDDLNWFKINNLPKNTIPYIRQAINCFQNKVFYSEIGWGIIE